MQLFALILLVLVGMTKQAHAYLDPGTGSYIFQAIAGGIFVIMAALGTIPQYIKGLFKKSKKTEKQVVDKSKSTDNE